MVYADIELINGKDLTLAKRNITGGDEIKRIKINALVDTGLYTLCINVVLPRDSEVLQGAIPLEDMDVLIHPQRQELIVNPDHPYFAQMKLK